ncbi:luciferin sulfotransferase [Stomoxys calcitrans]|uniref:Sulfotransferase domain-containing protein n=1 Tax=Stomoxys calcitrans TaxID=35570 RepID=A0A1I8P0S0_STOCA|nr:luciferin sulfotransferase [Stomoxys calcitrans]
MELTYKELNRDIAERIDSFYIDKNCFIEVLPGNVIVPRKYMEIGESIRNLKTYPDDVWVVSYPRTGSTWAQEMIWLLGNHLDFEGAKKMQQIRSPVVELSALFSVDHHEWVSDALGNTVDTVQNMKRPRFARSHLPWHLLPKDLETSRAKIIYTSRNPKDLCVSFYYYCKLMHGLQGSIDDFLQLFMDELTPIGSYWKHVLPFWKLSRQFESNVLFLKYEDMKRNLPETIQKCADFLNINYELKEEDMARICEHLKFDKMQNNPAVNLDPILSRCDSNGNGTVGSSSGTGTKFIRKGQIGDWKNYISAEMNKNFDKWMAENLKDSGLSFETE